MDSMETGYERGFAAGGGTALAPPPFRPAEAGAGASLPVCVHRWVTAQAHRTPDAVAVECGGEALAYGELERRARRLALHLRSLGAGPGVRVAFCLERSPEVVVAVLGILKAGAAYVPVDPGYPAERIEYMLHDARVPVVVTRRGLATALPVDPANAVCFEDEEAWGTCPPGSGGWRGPTPDDPAYVIYTSGSTGRPKGVAMPHRPLSNLLAWHQAELPGARRTLMFAPLSFDVSFQEVFTTLAAGGTLVIVPDAVRRDAPALLAALAELRVERLFLPFVALQQLADAAARGPFAAPPLREVVTAGEQLRVTPQLVSLFRALDGCTLHNHYGPTETHVVTAHTLRGDPAAWPALPPIGRPILNSAVHLLGEDGCPVPEGEPGELYLAGACVADGYLDRPALTAERFVPDPSSRRPGARCYRAGDLGRRLPDGSIEFLGRADDQVKIRGFRVEPAEVSAVLDRHRGVRESIVMAREAAPGERRLIAWVVPGVPAPTEAELRRHAAASLPEHMVPSRFVLLDRLPLTPSGKVDRRGLPEPDRGRPELSVAYAAPRTQTERTIAVIWQEVLLVEPVGIDDPFLELGGHSLLAAQIASRILRAFAVDLSAAALFSSPTVRQLAAAVDAAGRRSGAPAAIAPAARRRRRVVRGTDGELVLYAAETEPGPPPSLADEGARRQARPAAEAAPA
ncbi:MAG TPA: non-ribosomal peptide synthetase [Longimicrobium sp.]|nr:non-ribosomal peptide synthetase [Longimicrobium sp.]